MQKIKKSRQNIQEGAKLCKDWENMENLGETVCPQGPEGAPMLVEGQPRREAPRAY